MSIHVYKSTDTGAPSLDGQAGSLLAVIRACLVDGFGSLSVPPVQEFGLTFGRLFRLEFGQTTQLVSQRFAGVLVLTPTFHQATRGGMVVDFSEPVLDPRRDTFNLFTCSDVAMTGEQFQRIAKTFAGDA